MTDYEYIMAQCRKYHFTGWDESELKECKSVLPNLTREELVKLYRSRWVDDKLRKAVFKVLFSDKVGTREQRIKDMDTDSLIEEFKDKRCGNIALIRKEMRIRFKQNRGVDRRKIDEIFNVSLKSDQEWVRSQIRKEQNEAKQSKKYQWKKSSWT